MPYLAMQDGTKIYYEETGKDKKQTVLFAHGLNSSHLKVKTFLDQFRKDYHVVCYDQRDTISKITVPFMYVMPDTPLYSMETVNFYKNNVKGEFVLEKDFPNTTHTILMESPVEVAERIKAFIGK